MKRKKLQGRAVPESFILPSLASSPIFTSPSPPPINAASVEIGNHSYLSLSLISSVSSSFSLFPVGDAIRGLAGSVLRKTR
ncbi:hypothetical protein AKJ16_DCAP12757 [Drosera capensis]